MDSKETKTMTELQKLKADWRVNRGNFRGLFFCTFFRLANIGMAKPRHWAILLLPIRLLYTLVIRYLLSIDIPLGINIGEGLRIFHGFGIAIHPQVKIGRNCTLRHGVTIGNKNEFSKGVPTIGNNVDFGCYSVVVGNVIVGNDSRIGALCLVTEDVQDNCKVTSKTRK